MLWHWDLQLAFSSRSSGYLLRQPRRLCNRVAGRGGASHAGIAESVGTAAKVLQGSFGMTSPWYYV